MDRVAVGYCASGCEIGRWNRLGSPETNSPRRKPAPGMIFEAQHDHQLDLSGSYFIGDKSSDIACGKNAGIRTILVQTGYGAEEHDCCPDWIANDHADAADIILNADQ